MKLILFLTASIVSIVASATNESCIRKVKGLNLLMHNRGAESVYQKRPDSTKAREYDQRFLEMRLELIAIGHDTTFEKLHSEFQSECRQAYSACSAEINQMMQESLQLRKKEAVHSITQQRQVARMTPKQILEFRKVKWHEALSRSQKQANRIQRCIARTQTKATNRRTAQGNPVTISR